MRKVRTPGGQEWAGVPGPGGGRGGFCQQALRWRSGSGRGFRDGETGWAGVRGLRRQRESGSVVLGRAVGSRICLPGLVAY